MSALLSIEPGECAGCGGEGLVGGGKAPTLCVQCCGTGEHPGVQAGREGGHLAQAQSPGTRVDTGTAPGLVVGANTGALTRIAEKLRRAGAKLPMTVTDEIATREGLIASGLSIALCLVETEIESQATGAAKPCSAPDHAALAGASTQRQQHAVRTSTSTKAQGDAGKLIVVGGRQFNAQALLDLQHDAARYRWLRDKADAMLGVAAPMVASLDEAGRVITLLDGDDLDAAVDMVMAAPAVKRQRKTKRVGTGK